jgi:hydrogenase nickel incorporation protein HypA/HybF
MHEFSIATTLVEDVLKFAEKQGATRVVRVRLGIGELTCVQSQQLKFCYESVITETALAGSELEIEVLDGFAGRLSDCDISMPDVLKISRSRPRT